VNEHEQRPVTTTDSGISAPSDEHSLTTGPAGPIALHDHYLIQKMAQFNRERVPERVVHAKGSGAFGYFEANGEAEKYCRADFLKKGNKSEMLARFSTVAGEQGFPDTVRDPRGFSLKFYTDEGNYDLVGNNTPIFFVRDPSKFQDFIHSQKRQPNTGRHSHNMQWDFWTLSPETTHQVMWLMGDRGIPKSYRNMNGYGSHTFLWENEGGEKFWVKYHFKTDQGIEFFTEEEAGAMAAENPDFHRFDLWNAIESGDHPSWTLKVQIMPFEDAVDYHYNPFDLTKVWPQGEYPLIEIGRMVLDRNPENFFAQIEQAAFEPSNMVPGIGPSPDKMLLGRMFSYPDTHRYRIGPNYLQLPVNQPKASVNSYNFDGPMRYQHSGDQPTYAPNSYGGPKADPEHARDTTWETEGGEIGRYAYVKRTDDDDFGQATNMWNNVLDDDAKSRLVSNIVGHASWEDVQPDMKTRVAEYGSKVAPELGERVAEGLGVGAVASR